ncbi:MAG: heme-copper oxidase subunit III [Bacteroidia bacterium]
MWLFLVTIIMVFGGLTSGYIVDRAAATNPLFFIVPDELLYSTIMVLLSSIPVQFAVWKVRQGNDTQALIGLIVGLALGVLFMAYQFLGLHAMTDGGLPLIDIERKSKHGDSSVAFFYVFVALHGFHLISSMLALLVTTIQLALDKFRPGRKVLSVEITATFWHFLGLLWLYLYLFIVYTQRL